MIDHSPSRGRWRRAAIRSALDAAHHWKASVGFALLDQGMTSFASFTQTTIAARALPIDEFGRYVIVWSVSLLVVGCTTALIIDPLAAITSARRPSMRLPILAAAARLSFFLGGVLAALILISGLLVQAWSEMFGMMLLCLAVASPFQQMQMASRRFCYILRRQAVAAASAVAYATVLVGGVIGLWASDRCTAPSLILLSGAASLAACAVGSAWGCLPVSKVRPALQNWLMRQCWRTGRWLAGSSMTAWISNASILPITAAISGPSGSGILRAVAILFMPINQINWAMGSLLVPHLAEVSSRRPADRLRTAALLTIATLGAIATAYSVVILALGSNLLALIYNKLEITAASSLLWPFSISGVLDSFAAAMAIVLVANATTRYIFWARVASVAVFLPCALYLGLTIGLDGLGWAWAVANAIFVLVLLPALVRILRRSSQAPLQ